MATVRQEFNLPEELIASLDSFLAANPDWGDDRALTAAIALFLLQHNPGDRAAAVAYRNAMYGVEVNRDN